MDLTNQDGELPWDRRRSRAARRALHLVIAWSLDEPDRLGEVIAVERPLCVGRGDALPDDPAPRAYPRRVRPGHAISAAPFACARMSRLQLVVEPVGDDALRIRSVGRAEVRINHQLVTEGTVGPGDTIEVRNAVIFVVVARKTQLAAQHPVSTAFAFGRPDTYGIVGESEPAWRLREDLAFAASTDRHVLVLGESGVGKELAANAIHGMSARSKRALVARNAATMPDALIDAELFGNVKNYPNPGMPERPGLVGEADGSTLFLDEIGDLPESAQVHLLRALDSAGEYQRLGDASVRRSSFRLVAATNRPLDRLKHDFLARFSHRIQLPGLSERRDDIPLVLAELLRRTSARNPAIAERFFERRGGQIAEPRLAPNLVARLLRHAFTSHVRELDRLVWLAIGTADGDYLSVTPAVDAELDDARPAADPTEIDRDTIARALADHGQSPTRAAKALGLKNRFVLLRLMKKHGLASTEEDA